MAGTFIDDLRPTSAPGSIRTRRPATPPIDEIAAIGDPVLRNLWMTYTYARLAHRLERAFGPDHTWCTFATWTSVTAGAVVRSPQLPTLIDELLAGSEDVVEMITRRIGARTRRRRRIGLIGELDHSVLRGLLVQGLVAVSVRTARHTTRVFARLAPLFDALADAIEQGRIAPTDDVLDAIGLRDHDDAILLRMAFGHYLDAAQPGRADRDRAQLVLTANLAVTVFEQRLAQVEIAANFDPGNFAVEAELQRTISPLFGWYRRALARSIHDDIAEDVVDLWHHVSTRLLTAIVTPTEIFHVGRPVPPLPSGDRFPAALAEIDGPVLRGLVDDWDPTGGSGDGARTLDWADAGGRIGYLVTLLRSRQRDATLSTAPLTPGDVEAMRRGQVPPLR